MPRKRRQAKARREQLDPACAHFLLYGDMRAARALGGDLVELYSFTGGGDRARHAWAVHGEQLLADWIEEHPGTRPDAWWQYDAPEPLRRRVDGTGDLYGGIARTPRCGVPRNWVTAQLDTWLTERATDRQGQPRSPDPDAPPRFESQASYLDRHGLLTAGERRRVPAAAFEPEAITIAIESHEPSREDAP